MDNFTEKEQVLAKILYEVYGDHAEWKSWNDNAMPQFQETGDKVQSHWCAVASFVIKLVGANKVTLTPPPIIKKD